MGQHASTDDYDLSVLANYQSLYGNVRTGLLADGCTIVTDSGDTDPTGVVGVPAQTTYTNYEIWKMPGGVGLTDLYVKLGYGRNTNNGPSVQVTIGTGSDGAGTLTGDTMTARVGGAEQSGAAQHTYVSVDAGYLTILFAAVGEHGQILIERSIDGTGTVTNNYYTRIVYQNGNSEFQDSIMIGGGTQPPGQGRVIAATPTNWTIAGDKFVAFMHPIVRGGLANVSPNCAVFNSGDFVADTITAIDVYGSTKHYIPCSPNAGSGLFLMFRYD